MPLDTRQTTASNENTPPNIDDLTHLSHTIFAFDPKSEFGKKILRQSEDSVTSKIIEAERRSMELLK